MSSSSIVFAVIEDTEEPQPVVDVRSIWTSFSGATADSNRLHNIYKGVLGKKFSVEKIEVNSRSGSVVKSNQRLTVLLKHSTGKGTKIAGVYDAIENALEEYNRQDNTLDFEVKSVIVDEQDGISLGEELVD